MLVGEDGTFNLLEYADDLGLDSGLDDLSDKSIFDEHLGLKKPPPEGGAAAPATSQGPPIPASSAAVTSQGPIKPAATSISRATSTVTVSNTTTQQATVTSTPATGELHGLLHYF